jgi:hypothetical protein
MVFDRINEAARLWTQYEKAKRAGKAEEAKRIHVRYLKHMSTYGTKFGEYGSNDDDSFERRVEALEQKLAHGDALPVAAVPKGTVCANCKKHEATENWLDEGGTLAITHGDWKVWCKCCCLKAQIKFCQDAAKRLPELKKSLARIKCRPIIESPRT